ncbi:type II toxin-antitoxin system VapC family toxin [Haloparvum alkalitolerans]|uniref:PIN domain-containing protein n=1 Tax=Haloparvum alkalitolerans TaxID=1042953 RepID=UPI003CF558AE
MIALDTSFLVDYLDGEEATKRFLAERTGEPMHSPALSLFEVYRGAARTTSGDRIDDVADALDWVDPLPLDGSAADEAARIESELLAAGERINLGDVLIAGVCRDRGATIVSRDDHFDRVDGLDTVTY